MCQYVFVFVSVCLAFGSNMLCTDKQAQQTNTTNKQTHKQANTDKQTNKKTNKQTQTQK